MVRLFALGLATLLGLLPSVVSAQEWAEKMFGAREHDFGSVARGADTEFRFEITNIYKQPMNVTSVRSSCGCTSPSLENAAGEAVTQMTLKTYEKGYIVAKFNTRTHLGMKGATLTVTFGAPYVAEVQLRVHGNIRSDVVFTPGAVDFGDVEQGVPHETKVNVAYAGRSDWAITNVLNDNDMFKVDLAEVERTGGRVVYNLTVQMQAGVEAGHLQDQLTVVTNDGIASNQRIPLYVSANVRPEFTVKPEMLVLGDLQPGQEVTKKIVVRGREPFKILNVTCGDECFAFAADNEESKVVHFVEVKFRAGEAPAKFSTPITIVTDRGENRGPKFMASANVVAPAAADPAPASTDDAEPAARTAAAL